MFEAIQPAPPDPILGLTEAFHQDANPNKVDLSIGMYVNDSGQTPILRCVKEAEQLLVTEETTKAYLGIMGRPDVCCQVGRLLFGADHPLVGSGRLAILQTPGGTAAVRVAADFLARNFNSSHVWLSDPTWPNHPQVFAAAGMTTRTYAYFDATSNRLDFQRMRESLQRIPHHHIVVLHGCCHNPTGVDLSPDQWAEVGEVLHGRRLLPLIDLAYQGFAEGLDEDAAGLRALGRRLDELIVCSSFSKNFGLYRERVGAATFVARSAAEAEAVASRVKQCVRANYSNPPSHGGAIVATILESAQLSGLWHKELAAMRSHVTTMRTLLPNKLAEHGCAADFSFLPRQRGMFSISGLTPQQVDRLRIEHAVYLVGDGRINVAGVNQQNIDYVCRALAAVAGTRTNGSH
jgi:aspartate/tyrosine/aromatic aminotransferase